jgi:hypothetical protein
MKCLKMMGQVARTFASSIRKKGLFISTFYKVLLSNFLKKVFIMQPVIHLFSILGILVLTQTTVAAQNKNNNATTTTLSKPTTTISSAPVDARVTIVVGGVRISLPYENCQAYYNTLLHGNSGDVGKTDAQYARRDCQQGLVIFNFPECVKDWAEKNKNNPAVLEAMTTELEQLGQAAFCKKYIGTMEAAPSVKTPAVKKQ